LANPLPSFLTIDTPGQKLRFNPNIADIHFAPQFNQDAMILSAPYPQEDKPRDLLMKPGKTSTITFSVPEKSMVNIWTTGSSFRNVDLSLQAAGKTYISEHAAGMGDSLSYVLETGTYTLNVKNATSYFMETPVNFLQPIHVRIVKYNPTKIEGMVSAATNTVVPVILSGWQGTSLNSGQPLWVVVHGRGDSPDSDKMIELAQSLRGKGYQVATLDWSAGAAENSFLRGELHGTTWVESTGSWAADQLRSVGFTGDKIFAAGHSWGSFVVYEIGNVYKNGVLNQNNANGFGIQGIVALDSAINPLPANTYDETKVNFGSVSKVSWALRSSTFGSQGRANTAKANFEVMIPAEYQRCKDLNINPFIADYGDTSRCIIESDALSQIIRQHGYAVSLFASIVRDNYGDASLANLKVADLMAEKTPPIKLDPLKPDGTIWVGLEKVTDTFVHAFPLSLVDVSY